MRRLGKASALLAAALVACLAAPAGAVQPPSLQHTTMTYRGVGAEAFWKSDVEPGVGKPRIFSIGGFRSPGVLQRMHTGERMDQFRLPALLAMGMLVPGDEGPQPAEVWCLPKAKDTRFTIDSRLTSARLTMSCNAEVVTGEGDEPTGQTMALKVTASWSGDGALVEQRSVQQTSGDGWRTLERSKSKVRSATAMVRIVGPDGVIFNGPVTNDEDAEEMAPPEVSMYNTSQSMMVFGELPEPDPGK